MRLLAKKQKCEDCGALRRLAVRPVYRSPRRRHEPERTKAICKECWRLRIRISRNKNEQHEIKQCRGRMTSEELALDDIKKAMRLR